MVFNGRIGGTASLLRLAETHRRHNIRKETQVRVWPAAAVEIHAELVAGTPERIVIYHGGTGRTLFIGMLRVSTIFIFGVSTFIIAPTLLDEEHPWYIGLGGKT